MPKPSPFLWFNDNAEEAANFYTSIFPNSKITAVSRYGENAPGPKGQVMVVNFELDGQEFTGLNGGPRFQFTEAVSFVVKCRDQAELDRYWDALMAGGGKPHACGWLRDRFGLSWQIIPEELGALMTQKDPKKSEAVMQALWQMVKLDIAALRRAAETA
jgi:predicted 3-demethylubiquinone-9 3-methyltransferase (glyoxalase superfamily)